MDKYKLGSKIEDLFEQMIDIDPEFAEEFIEGLSHGYIEEYLKQKEEENDG